MTEMLERVARAIHAAAGHRTETWEQSPVYRNRYTALARAAIEAMREPTKKMIDTGGACIPEHWAGDNDLAEAWKNMIDVALVGAGAAPGPHERRTAGAMTEIKPTWEPIVLRCGKCGHEWDDWLPCHCVAAVWIAQAKSFRCPSCNGKRALLIRGDTPASEG